jgi:NhaP-type Na+/H+ or K+/H+ antiporter
MLVGIIFGPHVLNLVDVRSWGDSNAIVYEINRLVVSVQLISTALRYWRGESSMIDN